MCGATHLKLTPNCCLRRKPNIVGFFKSELALVYHSLNTTGPVGVGGLEELGKSSLFTQYYMRIYIAMYMFTNKD